ncbi:5-formyltetrahydrofolate cyclo-ligase [Porticoccus sp.]
MDNKAIRSLMRKRRRALTRQQQQHAGNGLAEQLCRLPAFRYRQRIAFYLANDGEIDPQFAMGIAQRAGKHCYLPVLHPLKQNRLHFVRHRRDDALVANRFGIREPSLRGNSIASLHAIDIILLPLVAFDRQGNRLGMGAGFYDRTLSRLGRRTLLIGLAHSCQETDSIARQPWDIPLHAIVTERQVIQARPVPGSQVTA